MKMNEIIKNCGLCECHYTTATTENGCCSCRGGILNSAEVKRLKEQADELHSLWREIWKVIKPLMKVKYKGELEEVLANFQKKYPEIKFSPCDDSQFSSSSLYFIPHKRQGYYMGNTVIFVSQCDNQPPIWFFLYPGHEEYLARTLEEIKKDRENIFSPPNPVRRGRDE